MTCNKITPSLVFMSLPSSANIEPLCGKHQFATTANECAEYNPFAHSGDEGIYHESKLHEMLLSSPEKRLIWS
ncbi:hypothetical protein BELL_0294g00040 [Botrytis elliptica]|uniref:Uncharacterized protein n=1 Tax=Botrytis elliptica TaxID=278938 RepID=A0A4Z1JKL6_9HELO|nr:hypothetical protein EAE99_000048 [Botrytis elliptica]TGO74281.1 hypothetical protein BELL_0294g00040 [Botrytis elliptica]